MALVCLALSACRESRVRAYTVPSEKADRSGSMASPMMGGGAPPPMTASAGGPAVPHWHLPNGWQEQPGNGMRYATIVVEPGDPPLEIRVTPLALAAKDPLENVNRWRGQIGLAPIGQSELGTVMMSRTVSGYPVEIVNMTGAATGGTAPNQILAAMLTTENQVWFFLMLDSAARVAKYAGPFETFIGDLTMTGGPGAGSEATGEPAMMPPAMMPPDMAPSSGAAAGETMTWTAPKGWERDPKASDMRVASFKLPGGAGEVAITKFPGDVGGLLANINRWRKQLEMPPVGGPEEQPSESVMVAGQQARLFDIAQPGSDAGRQRMIVVLLARPDVTWFLKMTGTAAALDGQAGAFRTFVQSVQLQGGSQ